MKKRITYLLLLVALASNAQQKSTSTVAFGSNMTGVLTLDNGTSTATLTLTGPNDRWFAMQFGSFTGGMEAGSDLVYYNGTTLVDARHNGVGTTPTTDASNNWTVVSNTNNSPTTGKRTIVATRPFSTGDSNDFTFVYANTNIDLAWAHYSSASYGLAYHGAANRGVLLDTPLTTLGIESFDLKASTIYPNPSSGSITISTKTFLKEVGVYDLNGKLIKTIKNEDTSENVELYISGLQSGIYMLELKNDTDKTWKKVVVE